MLIAVGAVVLAGAAGYGGGRFQGMQDAQAAHDEQAAVTAEVQSALETAENDAETARADVVAAQAETAEMRRVALRLDALRVLREAARHLEASNFGNAAESLTTASEKLGEAAGDDAEIARLAEEIAAHEVVASGDTTEQQQHFAAFIERLDAQIPPL